jgi:Xaa-Pro aminopeptidase
MLTKTTTFVSKAGSQEVRVNSNPIQASEFEKRISKLRAGMRTRNLDMLFVFSQKRSHVAYVSGYRPNYHTNSAIVLLPLEKEPVLVIKFPFDLPRAKSMSWFADIRGSASEDQEKMVAQCADMVHSLNLERSRIGLVASDLAMDELSASLSEALRHNMPNARFEPASDLLNGIRLVKSENEIALLRTAAEMAELVAHDFREAIKPGVKDRAAAAKADQVARAEGAEDCSIIVSRGPAHMALPPDGSEFERGDLVTCEITVRYQGYWVQICRVFSVGSPSAEHQEIFAACRSAYEAAVAVAQPGREVADLAQAAYQAIVNAGYKDYIQYGTGHGVGLDLPELYPLDLHCHGRLGSGMILVIHPAIWVPGRGTAFVGGPVAVSDGKAARLDKPQTEILVI